METKTETIKKLRLIKIEKEETENGKARWDVLVGDEWSSSWDRKKDALDELRRQRSKSENCTDA